MFSFQDTAASLTKFSAEEKEEIVQYLNTRLIDFGKYNLEIEKEMKEKFGLKPIKVQQIYQKIFDAQIQAKVSFFTFAKRFFF